MNSARTGHVAGAAATLAAMVTALGCVSIDGGAVELSWKIRTRSGEAVAQGSTSDGCDRTRIERIELVIDPVEAGGEAPCPMGDDCSFDCRRETGSTRFDIPDGTYRISLVPICDDGQVAAALVPPPVTRVIREGQVTSLQAVDIAVVSEGSACGPGG